MTFILSTERRFIKKTYLFFFGIMKQEKVLKKANYLRKKILLFAIAVFIFIALILVKKRDGLREFIFISLGIMFLTLVYLKMYTYLKNIKKK